MGDVQTKMLLQISDIRIETATLKTRQDFAFERLQGFLEMYEKDEERRRKDQAACRDMLSEILITQRAYSRLVTKVLPFMVVVFSVTISWVVSSWGG